MHRSAPESRRPALTEQEIEVARRAKHDLGAGYPAIELLPFVRAALGDRSGRQWRAMQPTWTAAEEIDLTERLASAVAEFLDLPPRSETYSLDPTFSGSVALDRAIQAALSSCRANGYQKVEVITTSPSIDIIPDLLEERPSVDVTFCGGRGPDYSIDSPGVVRALVRHSDPGVARVVLVCSPENPTGHVWDESSLRKLVSAVARADAILIVDHSFLVSGVQAAQLPRVWDIADKSTRWIATWDTGKTLGLGGEKLGFILASPRMRRCVSDAIRVLQFDVSRRQKELFVELLSAAKKADYQRHLASICRQNLDRLEQDLRGTAARTVRPVAGTLAMIELPGFPESTEEDLSRHLLNRGVGVVTGSAFFHNSRPAHPLLRVALARDPVEFAAATDVLAETLGELGSKDAL